MLKVDEMKRAGTYEAMLTLAVVYAIWNISWMCLFGAIAWQIKTPVKTSAVHSCYTLDIGGAERSSSKGIS